MAIDLGEELLQPARGDAGDRTSLVDAEPCTFDRLLVKVGGEDLDRCGKGTITQVFQQGDGNGDHLLPAGAARDPDTKWNAQGASFEQGRKDPARKCTEHIGIAKEARDVDQQIVIKRVDLRLVLPQQSVVCAQIVAMAQRHAAVYAAVHRGGLVQFEIDPAVLMQQYEDPLQIAFAL